MTFGHILDADNVETRIDVSRHSTIEEIDNDASRRRRFPITRTHGSRGIHHDCREAIPSGIHHVVFRNELRTLVMADHLIEASFGLLIGQFAARRHRDGSDTARVYKFLDACLA